MGLLECIAFGVGEIGRMSRSSNIDVCLWKFRGSNCVCREGPVQIDTVQLTSTGR